jgi:hypothetical protein
MSARLRAVPEGEKPEKPERAQSVTQAADGGNRRALLVALRSRIAKTVENADTPARDLASLARKLLEIAKEIEAIDSADGSDDVSAAAATPDDDWQAI